MVLVVASEDGVSDLLLHYGAAGAAGQTLQLGAGLALPHLGRGEEAGVRQRQRSRLSPADRSQLPVSGR